ncbi:MAG: sodium-dependent transporter [Prochloraceae cyanobacterium]
MTRQKWSSRTIFILAAVGSAVGLGNVWRFPYLAGKYGGGAFLVPYAIALLVVGIPLLMLEFAVGQKMQQGAIAAYKKLHPACGALGIFAAFSTFVIVSYYAVVMAWSLLYLLASFDLGWSNDSEGFFTREILQISESVNIIGGINWPVFIALLFVWIAVYFCVWKGTQSVGKVVAYTVPLPLILLGILLIRGVTLPGFLEGWKLYLIPQWDLLINPEVWTAAFSQIFFTLSIAFGVMIAYGSYKNSDDDIAVDSWITALLNSGISLFSGFVVFAVLGYLSTTNGTPVSELAAGGPGLAFVVFPEALSKMPLAPIFSALFFIMLLTLGIDSAFSLVEAINAAILDFRSSLNVAKISFFVCLLGFLAGIIYTTKAGLYFLDIADRFVLNYNGLITGICEAILVGWVYGAEKMRRYINEVSDRPVGKWWNLAIKYFIPIVLTALLAAQLSQDLASPYGNYPAWALSIGWALVIIPLVGCCLLALKNWQQIKRRSSQIF